MVKIANQLDQKILPLYCDEGVFRILIDNYLQRQNQFKVFVPMLGSFHTAKCLEHCIGKYIEDTGIDDCLSQTKVAGVKAMKSVFERTNYARLLKAILILAHASESLKWKAFMENTHTTKYAGFLRNIKKLQETLSKKDTSFSQDLYRVCADSSEELKLDFETFNKTCSDKSEMRRYWDGVIILTSKLKNFIVADREGNWEAHLQAIQDLLPIFCKSGSFNYQRYGSVYLEFMQKLPKYYSLIYRHFQEGKVAVKTSIRYFKAVGADMNLEQTIQRSKKRSGGV